MIAGSGYLPQEIINFCHFSQQPLVVVALKGQTDPTLNLTNVEHKWFRIGAAGSIVNFIHSLSIKNLILAGGINRPNFQAMRPDLWTVRFFAKTGAGMLGDDGLLSHLVKFLHEQEGFNIIGPHNLLPNLLATKGANGAILPKTTDQTDIEIGIKASLELGQKDIGQAAVAKDGKIIGLEDQNGTDNLLARISNNSSTIKRGVLVKMSKPKQEIRTDLPSIGPATVQNAKKADLSGIAIETGMSLILDREKTINLANKYEIFIFGIKKQIS